MREQGRKILRRTFANSKRDENNKQAERAESCPVLKDRTQADAAIVEQSKKTGEPQPDDHVRKIDGSARDAVELHRIQSGKNIACNLPHSDRFPRADDEVRQH